MSGSEALLYIAHRHDMLGRQERRRKRRPLRSIAKANMRIGQSWTKGHDAICPNSWEDSSSPPPPHMAWGTVEGRVSAPSPTKEQIELIYGIVGPSSPDSGFSLQDSHGLVLAKWLVFLVFSSLHRRLLFSLPTSG